MQSTHESKTPDETSTSSNPKKLMPTDTLIKKINNTRLTANHSTQLSWEAFANGDSHLAAIARTTSDNDGLMSEVITTMFAKKSSLSLKDVKNYFITTTIRDEKSAYHGHCALSLAAMHPNRFLIKIIERFKDPRNGFNSKEIFKLFSDYRTLDGEHSLYTLAIKHGCEDNMKALRQLDASMATFREEDHFEIAKAGYLNIVNTSGKQSTLPARSWNVVLALRPKDMDLNKPAQMIRTLLKKHNKKRKLTEAEKTSQNNATQTSEPASKKYKNEAKNPALPSKPTSLHIESDTDIMDLSADKDQLISGGKKLSDPHKKQPKAKTGRLPGRPPGSRNKRTIARMKALGLDTTSPTLEAVTKNNQQTKTQLVVQRCPTSKPKTYHATYGLAPAPLSVTDTANTPLAPSTTHNPNLLRSFGPGLPLSAKSIDIISPLSTRTNLTALALPFGSANPRLAPQKSPLSLNMLTTPISSSPQSSTSIISRLHNNMSPLPPSPLYSSSPSNLAPGLLGQPDVKSLNLQRPRSSFPFTFYRGAAATSTSPITQTSSTQATPFSDKKR